MEGRVRDAPACPQSAPLYLWPCPPQPGVPESSGAAAVSRRGGLGVPGGASGCKGGAPHDLLQVCRRAPGRLPEALPVRGAVSSRPVGSQRRSGGSRWGPTVAGAGGVPRVMLY